MKEFTVQKLAEAAGVTPRTLRYYDAVGLLKPSRIGANGYRYYGDEALLKLQQILLYRELDMPLEEITQILGRRDWELLSALKDHRKALESRRKRLEMLIETVDRTMEHLKGERPMSAQEIFKGFSPEEEARLSAEAEQLYDPEVVRESQRRWKAAGPEGQKAIMEEGQAVYLALAKAIPLGPQSPEAQALVDRWRRTVEVFWTPTPQQLTGLTELYESDPRFKMNMDRIDPRLTGFLKEAVKAWISRHNKS